MKAKEGKENRREDQEEEGEVLLIYYMCLISRVI